MNLHTASNQWAQRPADERFWSLDELLADRLDWQSNSHEQPIKLLPEHVRLIAKKGDEEQHLFPALVDPDQRIFHLTHHSFGQLCAFSGGGASYLRQRSPRLAVACIQEGLERAERRDRVALTYRNGGPSLLRSLTSTVYARVWDAELIQHLLGIQATGWRVPPARPRGVVGERTRLATEADVLDGQVSGLSIRVGDTIAPAGIYASDHDLFVFMVNENARVRQPNGSELSRGFFLIHSEVQCRVLGVVTFLYNHVCGNHIVWGAEDVRDHRIVHRGDALKIRNRGLTLLDTVSVTQREESAVEQEAIIQGAWARVLGKDKEEVVTIGQRMTALPKKTLGLAYAAAEQHPEDGHDGPNTAWGMIQGLTRVANDQPYADGAESLNVAASRILKAVS